MALSTSTTGIPTVPETLRDASGKEVKIIIRTTDCFVNVTEVCRSYGKSWSEFNRLPTLRSYTKRLMETLGLSQVIEVTVGRNGCTWADRRIAVRCLAWCNPDFEIAADELLLRYVTGQVTTEESRAAAVSLASQVAVVSDQPAIESPELGSFLSKAMRGRFISEFFDKKDVFYLILFTHDGRDWMKFGISDLFNDRWKQHLAAFKDMNMRLFFCCTSADS